MALEWLVEAATWGLGLAEGCQERQLQQGHA